MAGCVAGFAAAIAVAAVTGSVTFVHLLAMVLAYAAVAVFVAYLVHPDRGRR
jgi:Ca2+/Na+ antiporter